MDGAAGKQPMFRLVIEWTPGGQIHVSGAIHDKGACYAMLELAKDAIRENYAKQAQDARIAVPVGVTLPKIT